MVEPSWAKIFSSNGDSGETRCKGFPICMTKKIPIQGQLCKFNGVKARQARGFWPLVNGGGEMHDEPNAGGNPKLCGLPWLRILDPIHNNNIASPQKNVCKNWCGIQLG